MLSGLLSPVPEHTRRRLDDEYRELGHALAMLRQDGEKQASDAVVSRALAGRLYLSKSGWLLLSVPNAIGRGAFDALRIVGAELPTGPEGQYNAHVSVMSADEIESIGGPNKITERGHDFHYTLGAVKEVAPTTWEGVSRVWYITVDSPELRNLRKTYGLEPLRNGYDHHITFAIKRTGVERSNGASKFDVDQGREKSLTSMKMASFVRVEVANDAGEQLQHHYIRDNVWDHPAGRIEPNEPPAAAAARELLERTGYQVDTAALQDLGRDGDFQRFTAPFAKLKQIAAPGERGGYATAVRWQKNASDLRYLRDAFTLKLAAYKDDLAKNFAAARDATNTDPTEAQKASGNYAKGRVTFHGLPLTLENPRGSTRSGTDKNGKPWSITMKHDYGYIRRTMSEADGDHVDVFVGPDLTSFMVYVVDQNDPATGKFDEAKCMLGFRTKADAEQAYHDSYSSDWKGFRGIKSMHLNTFKLWLETGDTGRPVSG